MGATCQTTEQSFGKDNKDQRADFFSKIKYYGKQRRPPFGQVEIYHYKEHFITKIEQEFVNKLTMDSKVKLLSILTQEGQHSTIVYRIDASRKATCQSNYILTYYISLYTYTLKDYLQRNIKKNHVLESGQIWYILKTIAELGRFLQNQKVIFSRIHTKAIWISPAYQVKVGVEDMHLQKWPSIVSTGDTFLSPEQIENDKFYHQKQTNSSQNSTELNGTMVMDPYKSKVFALGMLILECYTGLDSIVSYYNYSESTIDVLTLNDDIKQISDRQLASILSRMLQVNPKKRVDFYGLCQLININQHYVVINDSLNVN